MTTRQVPRSGLGNSKFCQKDWTCDLILKHANLGLSLIQVVFDFDVFVVRIQENFDLIE